MDSPYEIFTAVRKRFRVVELVPVGFPLNTQQHVDFNEFRFDIKRENHAGAYSSLNVKVAGVPFEVAYLPSTSKDPVSAMDEAAWAAILAGPFKGRELYVDPREETEIRDMLNDESISAVTVQFSLSGEPIRGLTLSKTVSAISWKFFIPADSPEAQAIDLARTLKRERRMYDHNKTARGSTLIETLVNKLSQQTAALSLA